MFPIGGHHKIVVFLDGNPQLNILPVWVRDHMYSLPPLFANTGSGLKKDMSQQGND